MKTPRSGASNHNPAYYPFPSTQSKQGKAQTHPHNCTSCVGQPTSACLGVHLDTENAPIELTYTKKIFHGHTVFSRPYGGFHVHLVVFTFFTVFTVIHARWFLMLCFMCSHVCVQQLVFMMLRCFLSSWCQCPIKAFSSDFTQLAQLGPLIQQYKLFLRYPIYTWDTYVLKNTKLPI